MATFWGADTDQLREQSTASAAGARVLSETVTTALSLSGQVSWTGPDADEFRSRCDGVRRQLEDALEDLRRRADELIDHAEEQDAASDGRADSALGALGDRIGDLFSGSGQGFDPGDVWGPIQAPAGPVRDWIEERVIDPDRYDLVDRAVNWGQEAGGALWEKSMDLADEAKSSKLARFAKHGVPVIPDLLEVGYHIGQGDSDMAYATMTRASVEMIPGATWVDLGLGEISGRLGDEHTVFDSDIRWNEGTPLEVLTEYGAQKSDEAGLMEPGEMYGEKWADTMGVDNDYARNSMSAIGGIGVYGLMSSAPVTALEIGTDIPVRQKIWDGMNSPFD